MRALVLTCFFMASVNAHAGIWRSNYCDRFIDFFAKKQDQLFAAEDALLAAPQTCKSKSRPGACEDSFKKKYNKAVANYSDAQEQYVKSCSN